MAYTKVNTSCGKFAWWPPAPLLYNVSSATITVFNSLKIRDDGMDMWFFNGLDAIEIDGVGIAPV